MARGVETRIRHYRVNHDTGERTLNTDFNVFLALNAVSYLVFLILIFTVGAFGGINSTTQLLSERFRTVLTPDKVFFTIVWAIVVPYHGFWVVWQIVQPADRNCGGVVRASYFYPFMTVMYAGYTISCRYDAIILGTVFCYGLCGTMVGLIMSMQRYRDKMLPGYMIWQGPHSLLGAWIMIETMLMTNVIFVRLDEEWIIKVVIACVSLVAIFVTAIAWLSSYPVDLIVPGVLCFAVGGIYIELLDENHYANLFFQDYSDRWLVGAKYTVLAVFLLILVSLFLKVLVVLVCQRPKEVEVRRERRDPRTSISITIDTGKNKSKNNKNRDDDDDDGEPTKKKKRKPRRNREEDYDEDYREGYAAGFNDGYDVEDRPPPPPQRRHRSQSRERRRGSGGDRNNRRERSRERGRGDYDEESPRRTTKPKKKKAPPRKKKQEASSTSYDDDDF